MGSISTNHLTVRDFLCVHCGSDDKGGHRSEKAFLKLSCVRGCDGCRLHGWLCFQPRIFIRHLICRNKGYKLRHSANPQAAYRSWRNPPLTWSLQLKTTNFAGHGGFAPVIPAFGRLSNERCHEFVANFGYSISGLSKWDLVSTRKATHLYWCYLTSFISLKRKNHRAELIHDNILRCP